MAERTKKKMVEVKEKNNNEKENTKTIQQQETDPKTNKVLENSEL